MKAIGVSVSKAECSGGVGEGTLTAGSRERAIPEAFETGAAEVVSASSPRAEVLPRAVIYKVSFA